MTQSSSLDDVVSELRGLRGDMQALGNRMTAVEERSQYAADAATKAYQRANEAMTAADGAKQALSDTQEAMVRHAATVADASKAIVESNAEQTPILAQIQTFSELSKKALPLLLIVASVLGSIFGELVKAFLAAKGGHP